MPAGVEYRSIKTICDQEGRVNNENTVYTAKGNIYTGGLRHK